MNDSEKMISGAVADDSAFGASVSSPESRPAEEGWDCECDDLVEGASQESADEFAGAALGEVTLSFARNRLQEAVRDGRGADGGEDSDDVASAGTNASVSDDAVLSVSGSAQAVEAAAEGIDELESRLEDGERVFDSENVGLGVDIVEIEHMRKILQRSPSFSRVVFSADEQEYCEKMGSPETHYALRFAAKEAVVKALGTGFSEGIGVLDIEVRRNAKGRPVVVLRGAAKDIAAKRGVRDIPLSLSYTHTEAVACAMAITESSRKATRERIDPMEELTRKFKETRSMLDDL
jgi:holo-[acyl-carrier protein] synthase